MILANLSSLEKINQNMFMYCTHVCTIFNQTTDCLQTISFPNYRNCPLQVKYLWFLHSSALSFLLNISTYIFLQQYTFLDNVVVKRGESIIHV